VALGSIVSLSGILTEDSVVKVLRKKFGPSVIDINLKALEAGYRMGQAGA